MFRELLLSAPSVVCLLWAVALTLNWKTNLRTQKIGAITAFCCAINLLYWYLIEVQDSHLSGYLSIVYSFTCVGVYSLAWLFYRSLISDKVFTWKEYGVFIPPVLTGLAFTVSLFVVGVSNFETFIHQEDYGMHQSTAAFLMYILAAFVNNLMAIVAISLIVSHMIVRLVLYKENRNVFFPQSEGQQDKHCWLLFYGTWIVLALLFIYLVGDFFYYIEHVIPFHILFGGLACLFYFLGYQTYYLKRD
ncbi:hypothetical protein [Parabacteroides sp. PF5-6]|uniref:hypothetical protein n=1 Tax=Parabacteroides sp. PF5-6 TaxID=1742403 RepID=UPI0024061E7B|nr:hypothetical protein [Parabacteroides sp. PF5-6]MDF9829855.1 hypothetical protein [Parabacteroides sp. PF5-6]